MFNMKYRLRASPEQFAAMLEFMECHGDISRPQHGAQGRMKSDRLWRELGELLNSIGAGVMKPIEKWKKVWIDWKSKTKKKTLGMRRDACGTGGGPSSRQTLTAFEERVLNIIGYSAVVGQAEIVERGFDDLPSEALSLHPTRDPLQSTTDEVMMDLFPTHPIQVSASSSLRPPSGEFSPATPPVSTSTTALALMPVAMSPTFQRVPLQQQRAATPSSAPTMTTPRRRRLNQRRRSTQTPFERATSEFVAIEQRRLQLEEDREKLYHQREMERLQLESKRLILEECHNEVLNRLTIILTNMTEISPQLRPSSLP